MATGIQDSDGFPGSLSAKAAPIAADIVEISDSADAGKPKKSTLMQLVSGSIGTTQAPGTDNTSLATTEFVQDALAGAGMPTVNVTTATQAMAVNTRYLVNYVGGVCVLTLPAGPVRGDRVVVVGGYDASDFFSIVPNAGQFVTYFFDNVTIGPVDSLDFCNAITFIYDSTNTWIIDELTGNYVDTDNTIYFNNVNTYSFDNISMGNLSAYRVYGVNADNKAFLIEVPALPLVDPDTHNNDYAVQNTDKGKVIFSNDSGITAARIFTLLAPATVGEGWYCYFNNQNQSQFVRQIVTPASGLINGKATLSIQPGYSALVYCDGSNYYSIGYPDNTTYVATPSGGTVFVAVLPGILTPTMSDTITQGNGALFNSNVIAWPFVPNTNGFIVTARIEAAVGLAASTVTVGIYEDDGSGLRPSGNDLGAVSLNTATSGVKLSTFGSPIPLLANRTYWAAIQCSSDITLALTNIQLSSWDVPNNQASPTASLTVQALANAYSAGNLPVWSGTATDLIGYLPWVLFSYE